MSPNRWNQLPRVAAMLADRDDRTDAYVWYHILIDALKADPRLWSLVDEI